MPYTVNSMLQCIETARAALDDDRFGDAAMYARSAAQHEESLRIDVSRVERNEKHKLDKHATSTFVSRTIQDHHCVKVVLNPDTKIYPQQCSGVDIFVYRRILDKSNLWDAIEVRTGAAIVQKCSTKKECIKRARGWINETERIQEMIDMVVDIQESHEIMSQDEYLAMPPEMR